MTFIVETMCNNAFQVTLKSICFNLSVEDLKNKP